MNLQLESPQGDAAFSHLMQAPVVAKRKSRKTSAMPKAKPTIVLITLADCYYNSPNGKRDLKRAHALTQPLPTYYDWLKKHMSAKDAKREAARAKAEWAQRKAMQ